MRIIQSRGGVLFCLIFTGDEQVRKGARLAPRPGGIVGGGQHHIQDAPVHSLEFRVAQMQRPQAEIHPIGQRVELLIIAFAVQITLGGIFDEFTFPPAYWPVLLAVTAVVGGTLVLVYGPRRLRRGPA